MKKYFKYVLGVFVVITAMSCSEDYLDVNTDPNNPLTVTPDLALPVAQVYTAQDLMGSRRLNTFGNLMMANWSQSDGFSWYYDEFNYLVNQDFYSTIWNSTYSNTLKQYNYLANLEDINYSNYKAIGEIMKAYHFQILVDTYGNIPYSEALLRGENTSPKYDDAQTIYEDLIVKLDAAIALIKVSTAAETPVNDILFAGDMTSWIKFANTVKLRVLVRQSGMASRAAYVQGKMDAIVAEGTGFITTNAMINPGYLNEVNKVSPFYAGYGLTVAGALQNNGEATCATDYIINYMTSKNDLRINYIYKTPATGHRGVPQGLLNYPADGSFKPQFVSKIGPGILYSATQNAPLMLLTEALFLQSEAVERGFMAGNAQALYEAAIDASFSFLGAGSASFYYTQTSAVAAPNVNWTLSTNKIQAIITQKWLALNGTNGHESWVEYNRTGYPTGLPIPQNNTNSNRPVRLAYPSSEITGNTSNVPAQPNVFTQKIFWAN